MTTLSPDYVSLLRSVIDSPDDDAPRLVLADWLDEHSCPERAEFIRVQCAIQDDPNDKKKALRSRERELWYGSISEGRPCLKLTELPDTEVLPLPALCIEAPPTNHIMVRRGFVSSIACPLATWYGGLCGRCEGGGVYSDRHLGKDAICARCHGSGHAPGIGPKLVRLAPLTEVRVTDRKPAEWTQENGTRDWVWVCPIDNQIDTPRNLPRNIRYASEALAHADLNRALLAWARATEPEGER